VQQTPSVQKPEAQSSFLAQLMPGILSPQLPFMHCTPTAQSVFAAHESKQSCFVASQENGAHTLGSAGAHAPAPSQVWMPVTAETSQVPALQTVPMTNLRHAPWPSHVPSVPQVERSAVGQVDAARGLRPAGTNEQVPIMPWTLQDLQVSSQAVSQQTPSTQKPD
jgi:hypothetical protein